MRTRLRFAPLRGAVLSCLAKKVPKEGAAGEALTSAPIVSLAVS